MAYNGITERPTGFAVKHTWFLIMLQTLPSSKSDWAILGQSVSSLLWRAILKTKDKIREEPKTGPGLGVETTQVIMI